MPGSLQGPGVIKAVFGSLRGYAGNISAAGALDAVSNDGNTLIIDIRHALSPLALCLSQMELQPCQATLRLLALSRNNLPDIC